MAKSKFLITPHFRLHEWVAEEKGYFKAQGLDYEFRKVFDSHKTPNKVGAPELSVPVQQIGSRRFSLR